MPNGEGDDNSKKKSVGLISKNNQQLCKCSTLFLEISLPLLLQRESSSLNVPAPFFFSLALIFTLLAASISHFLTAAIKFSC